MDFASSPEAPLFFPYILLLYCNLLRGCVCPPPYLTTDPFCRAHPNDPRSQIRTSFAERLRAGQLYANRSTWAIGRVGGQIDQVPGASFALHSIRERLEALASAPLCTLCSPWPLAVVSGCQISLLHPICPLFPVPSLVGFSKPLSDSPLSLSRSLGALIKFKIRQHKPRIPIRSESYYFFSQRRNYADPCSLDIISAFFMDHTCVSARYKYRIFINKYRVLQTSWLEWPANVR